MKLEVVSEHVWGNAISVEMAVVPAHGLVSETCNPIMTPRKQLERSVRAPTKARRQWLLL